MAAFISIGPCDEDAMATGISRSTREMMMHVQEIINSNYHLYEHIVDPQDASEHRVDEAWADRNFKIREFYLLQDDDEDIFVGAGSFQVLDDFAYVGYLYIRHGFQRRGYGERLISFLERRAIEDGIADLRLFVNEQATWAREFYKKMGFSIYMSRKADILGIGGGIMCPFYEEGSLFMRKSLASKHENKK